MKFISKSGNLNIVLSPGLQAQPLTGTPAKPTIFVRFKDGVADVEQEDLVKMMLAHDGFNRDFISAEDVVEDPYVAARQANEPQYVTEELIHGQAHRRAAPLPKKPLSPEIKKLITEQATEIAKEMLPGMVEAVLKSAVKKDTPEKAEGAVEVKDEKEVTEKIETKVTKKPGRPKAKPAVEKNS